MGDIKTKIQTFYKRRNIYKTVTWRTFSFCLSFIIGFLITGSVEAGGLFAVFDFTVKSAFYFAHERYWNKYTINRIRKIKKKEHVC